MRSGPWLHLPDTSSAFGSRSRARAEAAAADRDEASRSTLGARSGRRGAEPEERVRQVLRKQVTQGACTRSCMICSTTANASANWPIVASLAHEHGAVNAARYRDAIGLGRKRTIQILEFFDRIGYTRRVHDAHVLRTGQRMVLWKAHAPGGAAGLQTQQGASDASW